MKSSEYRLRAREALEGQWGINAGITFLNGIITSVIGGIVGGVVNFPVDSVGPIAIPSILNILVLFAFDYALYYIGLAVIRGKRAEVSDLFAIFQGKYYFPMMIFNLISTLLQFLLGLVVAIPILLMVGTGAYLGIAANGAESLTNLLTQFSGSISIGLIIAFVAVLILLMLVSAIVSGIFMFAAWAKIENPDLPVSKALSYGWFLLKDRMGKFILLNISFVGWLILSAFALFIPLFWLTPYINVTIAAFYDQAVQEKGAPQF